MKKQELGTGDYLMLTIVFLLAPTSFGSNIFKRLSMAMADDVI
jgi:hypothetical protein